MLDSAHVHLRRGKQINLALTIFFIWGSKYIFTDEGWELIAILHSKLVRCVSKFTTSPVGRDLNTVLFEWDI